MGRKKASKKPASFGFRGRADDGHKVSSKWELLIDNWLHDHGVKHEIHPKVKNIGYADWKVGDTYVEFFGIRYIRACMQKRSV
jgi:hypothetical protein